MTKFASIAYTGTLLESLDLSSISLGLLGCIIVYICAFIFYIFSLKWTWPDKYDGGQKTVRAPGNILGALFFIKRPAACTAGL